jgi:L-ribulose-5-phosphate 4-epimerase
MNGVNHMDANDPLKTTLAMAIQMMERAKYIDFNGHFSTRLPGTQYVLINSAGASRNTLGKADIITIDLDGRVVEGIGRPPNEYPLHTEIYRRRPDVQAVAHTHPQWSTMFTITQIPLRPVIIQGAVLGEVPVFQKSNSISNVEIAQELAETLGNHQVALLKAHGAVIVGEGIVETFVKCVFLEENAYRQYMASQMGYPHSLSEDEIDSMARFLWQPSNIQKVWDYHQSKL